MKKSSINWSVKQFMKMATKGTISFNYPIQREGEQWDLMQKSLLIHSLAEDYPVPALYSVVEQQEVEEGKKPVNVYYILDGKQRLTNIQGFINGDYFLHEDTPPAVIDGVKYQLSEMAFSELNDEVKDAILDFSLQIYKMDEITDEQIEDLFYRLNNGTPLSKQQKAKAQMGTEWAKKIQGLMNHNLMKEKANFTDLQIRQAHHELSVLQTMMMLDDSYDWQNISSNEVAKYAETFRGDDSKDAIVSEVKKAMDYLDLAFAEKEAVMLRKINFPMTLLASLKAIEEGILPVRFSDWRDEFKVAIKPKHKKDEVFIATDYKKHGGAGSVKKDKTLGRVEAMKNHMNEYFKQNSPLSTTESVESKIELLEEDKQEQTA